MNKNQNQTSCFLSLIDSTPSVNDCMIPLYETAKSKCFYMDRLSYTHLLKNFVVKDICEFNKYLSHKQGVILY